MGKRVRPRRPAFDWWDDAVEVAIMTGQQTGVKHRVRAIAGPRPWQVAPATPRLVEVPC